MKAQVRFTLMAVVVLTWSVSLRSASGDDLRVDLTSPSAAQQWVFKGQGAKIADGELVFDGRKQLCAGFFLPHEFRDVVVKAKFRVEPQAQGVLACGFMVRVADGKDYITVCEDAGAGAYEAFPDVCRLNDGRLMVVFYAGYGHVALPCEQLPKGGRVAYCTSADEGRTWSPAQTLVDTPDDDRDPSIVQLPNGRLICNYFSLRKETGTKRPWTGLGTWIVTSDDLGRTWSTPRQISKSYYCSSPIRLLSTGRLILGLYAESANSAHGAVIFSDDGGQTWNKEVDIDNGGVRLDAETDLIELKDHSLYAVLRAKACFATSSDRGAMWTVSKPIGFPAHCPYLLRTKDDIILLAHRLPSTSLHYSLDECRTWSENVLVDEVGGAYPSMVNLKDGSVLIVYYEEGAGSNIRAKRFRATRQGIEWLPAPQGPANRHDSTSNTTRS